METHTKRRPGAPAGFFGAEAAGLRWLALADGARVVDVVAHGDDFIELERITQVRPTAAAAEAFGSALATTHGAGADAFGAAPSGWSGPLFIGEREMPRTTAASWGAFYAPGRVEPFLDPAIRAGNLRPDEAALVRDACALIADGAFDDDEPPARIHGDLWSGNVLFADEGVVLIDPAAHGGHRETDLAMLALFGAPYFERIVDGYQRVTPLRDGWRSRLPLHQLHPLAVHAVGHGRAYGEELASAASEVLALAG